MHDKTYQLTLFQIYPEIADTVARIQLGTFPTPVHPLAAIERENLWIKREDLSSDVYGGNKIRKLEFILAEARRRHCKHLITFGGIGTHHGLATAIFCNQIGIRCTLLLFHQPVTEQVKQNLLLLKKFNARMMYKKTLWRAVVYYYLIYRITYPGAYFVYAGGSSMLGNIGHVDAAFELKEQIERGDMPEPALLFCPVSSGGTLAGLSLGLQLAGLTTHVVGVQVTASHLGPFQACTKNTVEKQMKQTYSYLKERCRRLPNITIKVPSIMENYLGEGYGVPTDAGNKMSHLLKETEGISLDPTYTAKTFAAVMDYCRKRRSDTEAVLYWHTFNSVDLSAQAKELNYLDLPPSLQRSIDEPSVIL